LAIEAQPVATPANLLHGDAETLVVGLVLVPRLNAKDRPQVIYSDLTFEGVAVFILQQVDERCDPRFLDGALLLLFGRGRPQLLGQPDACARGLAHRGLREQPVAVAHQHFEIELDASERPEAPATGLVPQIFDFVGGRDEHALPRRASGIKLIGIGDITDDDVVNLIGDTVLGTTTSLQYSAAHPSAKNKAFVDGFTRISKGKRPDHVGVAVYDGMYLIYEALKNTRGNANGDALIAAMKGMTWESPRGTITVDPETRDLVQDVYIRRVERVDGELYNVEFDKYDAVKDPGNTALLK
jgi:Periplasmic binding protein